MLIKKIKKAASFVVAFAMVVSLVPQQLVFAADYSNKSWAAEEIADLLSRKIIEADEKGNIGADENITRGEFFKAINSALGFTELADVDFSDLSEDDAYYDDVQIAVAEGYVAGFPDGTVRANQAITRAEAAKVFGVALGVTPNSAGASVYKDASEIEEWYIDYVGGLTSLGILNGVGDNKFAPTQLITTAEAYVMTWRAEDTTIIRIGVADTPYGNDNADKMFVTNKNIIVTEDGVTLQNIKTTGYVTVAESVGNGAVTLDNVDASSVNVYGGGANSIHMNNCKVGKIKVDDKNGAVRVELSGNSNVQQVSFSTGGRLEAKGDAVKLAVVNLNTNKDAKPVQINGNFAETTVQLNVANTVLQILDGQIGKLAVSETAKDTVISIAKEAIIKILEVLSTVNVSGEGKVEQAIIAADDVKLGDVEVAQLDVDESVTTAPETKETPAETPAPPAGNNGGGNGGGGDPQPTPTPNSVKLVNEVNTAITNMANGIKSDNATLSYATNSKTLNVTIKDSKNPIDADKTRAQVLEEMYKILDKYGASVVSVKVDGVSNTIEGDYASIAQNVIAAMKGYKNTEATVKFTKYNGVTISEVSATYKVVFTVEK